jgi:hypothetical protein
MSNVLRLVSSPWALAKAAPMSGASANPADLVVIWDWHVKVPIKIAQRYRAGNAPSERWRRPN